ncbi:MAG: sulfatase, partial [Candidatus Omnitrophica bacterium]|nr:sulfatase [Candidatus Omnitrophota bacterium]
MKKKTVIITLVCFLAVAATVFLAISVTGKRGVTARKIKNDDDIFKAVTSGEEASSEKPNIVLIVVDTLRADHVSSDGYFRDTTPRIDNFAKTAYRFTNLVSASSWTVPSHMSMFTGLYPGVHKIDEAETIRRLDGNITTLAELLKKNGYRTAGFITNPLLIIGFGFARGFDFYDNFTLGLAGEFNLFADQTEEAGVCLSSRTSPIINKATLNWLKTNHDKKFFLFVHYYDPHYYYLPQPPYDTLFDPGYKGKVDGRDITGLKPGIPKRDLEHIVALYDGEIRYTDEYIGALLRELDSLGLKEKTLFIITSDHGDEFF